MTSTPQTNSAPFQPIKAAVFMVGAMVSFTLMAIAGRSLSATLDTFEIMLYRSLIGVCIVIAVAFVTRTTSQITPNRLGLHGLRNIFHFAGQNLWFYALIYIPLSQLFAFEFTSPLWVALFAPLFLGERMTRIRAFAIALGFVGILFVARPESTPLSVATFAAATCAICFAVTSIATKRLGQTEATISIMFWITSMQAVFGLICAGYDGDIAVPTGNPLLWVTLVGLCGLTAHYCITTALKLAPATVVMPLDFLRLPLIAIIGWVMYAENLAPAIFIGAALVFCANYINIRAERTANKKLAHSQ